MMFKLWATIIKDIRILTRDKVGLALMFGMPVLLVLIVTSIQNSTFQLINKNKISLLICNRDTGKISNEFIEAINKIDMFKLIQIPNDESEKMITDRMHTRDVLLAMVIPKNFSEKIDAKAKKITGKALNAFGLEGDTINSNAENAGLITLFYQPILQESFRHYERGCFGVQIVLPT